METRRRLGRFFTFTCRRCREVFTWSGCGDYPKYCLGCADKLGVHWRWGTVNKNQGGWDGLHTSAGGEVRDLRGGEPDSVYEVPQETLEDWI